MIGLQAILLLSATLSGTPAGDTTAREKSWVDSLKPFAEAILEKGDAYLPEGLKRQKAIRRDFQRRGYANVLFEVLSMDVLGGVISYVKMHIWLVYSTPHHVYWIIPPRVEDSHVLPGVPFPDNESYPENPWKKDHSKRSHGP